MQKLQIPQNLTALAYQTIKRGLLEGAFPDMRLTEESLSNKLGISKSPVREALNTLQAEGLIRIEPRRGAYLREFTPKEVLDLYDVREALEAHAVRAARVTPELLATLEESIERTVKNLFNNDKLRHIEEDTRFHQLLAGAAENEELRRILGTIQNQIWLFRTQTYSLSSGTAPDAHRTIVEALRCSDHLAAEEAIRSHIRLVRDRLLLHLREQAAIGH